MINNIIKNERGGILIISLILLSALLILGLALIQFNSLTHNKVKQNIKLLKALYIAEAGIERAIVNYLIQDNNKDWSDNTNHIIYEHSDFIEGNFTVATNEGNANTISLTSTGKYKDVSKQIDITLTVNWTNKTPTITQYIWQE